MWQFWKGQIALNPAIVPSPTSRFKKTDFLAMTNHWTTVHIAENGKETIYPNCGQVLFCKNTLGAGIVSHEMTHAALYWHHRNTKNFNPLENHKHDEALAWTQGHLVNQFWRRYYAREKT